MKQDFRELAKLFKKVGDTLDQLADNQEDKTLDAAAREEKEERLMGEFLVQCMKINALKWEGQTMNKVHKTTIKDRMAKIKAAITDRTAKRKAASKDQPLKNSITVGVEVKSCGKCERVNTEKLAQLIENEIDESHKNHGAGESDYRAGLWRALELMEEARKQ